MGLAGPPPYLKQLALKRLVRAGLEPRGRDDSNRRVFQDRRDSSSMLQFVAMVTSWSSEDCNTLGSL